MVYCGKKIMAKCTIVVVIPVELVGLAVVVVIELAALFRLGSAIVKLMAIVAIPKTISSRTFAILTIKAVIQQFKVVSFDSF